jgi:transglutaminase-like putative cysteine protease
MKFTAVTRSLFTLTFISAFGLLAAVLPPAFTAEGNPSLYKTLHGKAETNLEKLSKPRKKAYQKLLKKQNDILMSYLIAYESDGTLECARPEDVLSNYREVALLLETRGTTHDPEFFLSYVADQTVSDERIEAYRAALLEDGLRDIMDSSENEIDLYRKVSQWCVARLKFQPTSGRDQSPLDITQKSLLGRCEEMQILFVAAARTVGLPSRAASTPWWPHQDNNHAWAEVWLEGAWHYTGDMDAAYYPDQTWFSGLIDKTVLILADGSLPSKNDEVLAQGKYECVINSIRNYAGERARSLSIRTVDESGKPLPGTAIGVMVYNWNSLRPLTWIETDSLGTFTLSVGRGAFYLSAYKDGKQALTLVPSSEDKTMEVTLALAEGPLPDQDAMLLYPSNPFEWKQAPESWNEGVQAAKDIWNKRDREFNERYSDLPDSLLAAFGAAFRGNYREFERFLDQTHWLDGEFMTFVLGEGGQPGYIDPKFLWQATADQVEALALAFMAYEHEFYYEDLASVLQPSVYYEELGAPYELAKDVLTPFPKAFFNKAPTRLERLNNAMAWLKKKYRIDSSKALDGLLPLDVAIRQKYLTPLQYRMMAVSIARTNRVPAEFSYQPNLIYVQYDNGSWGYYDVAKCAPEANMDDKQAFATLKILASDDIGAPVTGMPSSLALTRSQKGSFYWLDQPFTDEGNGVYSISVLKGEYYLQAGYRVSDSQTAFQMKRLDLVSLDSLRVELTLREFPRKWSGDVGQELLALIADADTMGYKAFLIGNHDRENSIRLAEKLRAAGIKYLWLGYEPSPQPLEDYVVSPAWKALVEHDQRNRVRTITLIKGEDGKWRGSYEGLWDRLPE